GHQHRDDDDPASDAEQGAERARDEADHEQLRDGHSRTLRRVDALELLAADPASSALFLDVDGVLAPIVERPQDASVPEPTRRELERLAAAYRVVACVTGRPSDDARAIVGVDGIRYLGQHGLELSPDASSWAGRIHAFAAESGWPDIERKPLTAALH